MFDYTQKKLLNLTQIAAILGKHRDTILRWMKEGDKKTGFKLEYIQTPRGPETSLEAVWRFSELLKTGAGTLPEKRLSNSREKDAEEQLRRSDWD